MKIVFLISLILVSIASSRINEKTCLPCHGNDWSKNALDISRNVSEMTHQEIENALIGYKNGTYGKDRKTLMAGQLRKYSIEELKEFAQTIGK